MDTEEVKDSYKYHLVPVY